MKYDVVTIGEILVEILTEKVGQRFDQSGILLGPYPSGAPAIAIDQVGRMGKKCAIIAKVGKDDFGKLNLDRLSDDGVDITQIIQTDMNSTGTAFVTYFENGERQFIFHFTHAACGELGPEDIQSETILSTRYLHIMGCSITGSPSLGEAIIKSVRIARENGIKISFDPNIRPELLNGQIMDYYREILETCDVLLTGKSELRFLYGDDNNAIRQLLEQKDRIIVVKNGAKGTSLFTRSKSFQMDTYPAVEADPTGAGDCFDATFLSMLCSESDLETAVNYANAAGALAVQKRGPMEGNSFKHELDEFLATVSPAKVNQIPLP